MSCKGKDSNLRSSEDARLVYKSCCLLDTRAFAGKKAQPYLLIGYQNKSNYVHVTYAGALSLNMPFLSAL